MEHFWATQAYGVGQDAEYNIGVPPDIYLLLRCDCLMLMCTFLGELPQKFPETASPTPWSICYGRKYFWL